MKIGFICVHNSCRSQMAEALAKKFASDVFEVYSAGTELVPNINKDAVRLIKSRFNLDMSNQYSKLINDIPQLDIVVTMGCNVNCPNLPCSHREDWGLDDPSGKSDVEFNLIIDKIYNNILDIKKRYNRKEA